MIAAFDASVLVYLFDENASPPKDPDSGLAVSHCKDRLTYLITELQRAKAKIIVPAPALGEVLVYGGDAAPKWLEVLSTSRHVRISAFDERAAVEFAAMERERMQAGPRAGISRAKAKFDQQIVAIARVEGASTIYSDDDDIRRLAGTGCSVLGVAELPLPPQEAQMKLALQTDLGTASEESAGA